MENPTLGVEETFAGELAKDAHEEMLQREEPVGFYQCFNLCICACGNNVGVGGLVGKGIIHCSCGWRVRLCQYSRIGSAEDAFSSSYFLRYPGCGKKAA